MKPVVMVTYGGGHVTMLAPVARVLIERGTPLLFLAMTTAGAYLERLGLPYMGYQDLPGAQDEQVQGWGRELARDLPANSVVPLQESIAYLGLNYQDLVYRLGVEGAKQAYIEQGRHAFLPVTLFKHWLAEIEAGLVVATNSPRSERAALEAARALNTPSICAVDVFGIQEIQWIKQPNYASRICLLNNQVREWFIAQGCQPQTLVVTGNPAFERLQYPSTREAGRAMRQAKGWADNETVILWASQPEPLQHPFQNRVADALLPRKIEAHLRGFIARHSNFRLVVRYHPGEQGVLFKTGEPRVEQSLPSEDLSVLLNAVDKVVTLTSTVGLEGYLAGKPVISVRGSVFDEDVPYGEMGIATAVNTMGELDNALLTTNINNERSDSVETLYQQLPTQRMIEVIDELYSWRDELFYLAKLECFCHH